jgi:hypothetical protein
MVAQCANPKCRAQFLYLRSGKLFALRRGLHASRVEFFWLCGNCAGGTRPESFLPDGVRRVLLPFDHVDPEIGHHARQPVM